MRLRDAGVTLQALNLKYNAEYQYLGNFLY